MKSKNLTGQRFGKLFVLGDSGQRKDRSIVWRCRCDCGGEKLAVTHELTGGVVTNCGCEAKPHVSRRKAEDLTGRRFGMLTVLYRIENKKKRTQWLCQCDCGKLHPVTSLALKQGRVKSCGCGKYDYFCGIDLTGQRFDRVLVLYPKKERRKGTSVVWHCRCDCGNEFDTTAECLTDGHTHSCGCLTRELGAQLHTYLHCEQGTCVESLIANQRNHKNNTSGFRGVYPVKNGSFRAAITFQKTYYQIGTFRSFEDAVRARLDAEAALHGGFVDAYRHYQKRAEVDPEWARKNPFYYKVERVGGQFRIDSSVVE